LRLFSWLRMKKPRPRFAGLSINVSQNRGNSNTFPEHVANNDTSEIRVAIF